jgi:hypothetical protein
VVRLEAMQQDLGRTAPAAGRARHHRAGRGRAAARFPASRNG